MESTEEKFSWSGKKRLLSETYIPSVMPRILGTWDMSAIFMVSIYLSTCATTVAVAGPAAITYLLLAGLTFFVPCLIATAQLGNMYPFEGALYNWTHHAIGGYWSFFSGFCAWFPCVLIICSLANLLVSYAQAVFQSGLTQPWQQGLGICIVLIVGGIVATWRFRLVQNIINLVAGLIILSTLLMMLAGVFWIVQKHPVLTSFGDWSDWNLRPTNFAMFGLFVFAYIGTEGPLTMAGEVKEQRAIKRHLLWGGLLIFFTYLANTTTVLIVLGPSAVKDPLAMVNIVAQVLGQPFAYIVGIGLMSSFFATVLVYHCLYARLLLVAAIDRRLPRAVGKLNKYKTPANAIAFQTVLAVLFTLLVFVVAPLVALNGEKREFPEEVYNVCLAAASLVWTIAVMFLFIDLIGCYKRDRQRFLRRRVLPLPLLWLSVFFGLLSCLLTIVDTLFFSWVEQLIPNQHWWYLVGSLTCIFLMISGFSSILGRSEADWQEMQASLIDTQKNKAVRPWSDHKEESSRDTTAPPGV